VKRPRGDARPVLQGGGPNFAPPGDPEFRNRPFFFSQVLMGRKIGENFGTPQPPGKVGKRTTRPFVLGGKKKKKKKTISLFIPPQNT